MRAAASVDGMAARADAVGNQQAMPTRTRGFIINAVTRAVCEKIEKWEATKHAFFIVALYSKETEQVVRPEICHTDLLVA
ncbi:hypothetical protein PsorP6_017654 [Peronosclerospora sorghi]|uniref:Uncharacterized protein n=1 Tax=Peronosclerospora sorghi TaxID=230839 RepID=A0ACC0WNM7_9STRA|nr:hypothetical protein PsorP6_017654 [Peronosclerospora sorghi]